MSTPGAAGAAGRATSWTLLDHLDPRSRAELLGQCRRRSFERGEIVCRQGDVGDSMFLVETGRLAVSTSLPSGDRIVLRMLGAGDYFGEMALVRPVNERTAEVRAMHASSVLVLLRSTFDVMRAKDRSIERALVMLLADRVDQLSNALLESLFVGLDRRVTRRLVELAGTEDSPSGRIELLITQAQLADLAGGTRPSVNATLQRLARAGLISVSRGRITVHDLAQLRRRAATNSPTTPSR